jgi:hypothetical protein
MGKGEGNALRTIEQDRDAVLLVLETPKGWSTVVIVEYMIVQI